MNYVREADSRQPNDSHCCSDTS